jgi:hypothetical protein
VSVDDAAVAVGGALTGQLVAAESSNATNDDHAQSVLPNAVDAAARDHEPARCTPIGSFQLADVFQSLIAILDAG